MSQNTDYSDLYNDTLNNLPSMEEEILNYGTTSSFFKKLVNTTRSAKEKLDIVKQNTLNKELIIDDYQQGNIISMSDADSGIFIDAYGNQQAFRFADFNPIDAIDKEKAREASLYKKSLQPKLVSSLVGKEEKDLTENDYTNVANYQFNEVFKSLNNKDYTFSPYDANKNYTKENNLNPVPFAYKIVGEDSYGRKLIEAINPNTNRQVSFDMSNNPFLNSSFNLYKSIDTDANKTALDIYMNDNKLNKYLKEIYDTDGRFGETLDMAQSSIYQSAARVLEKGPEWLVDKEKWEKIADYKTGQALADAWAGVKPSSREDYQKAQQAVLNNLEKGNYKEAIIGTFKQLDRIIADSAAQSLLMAGTTAITAGLASEAGLAAGTAKVASVLSGAMAAATDQTLISIKEYESNNNKEMPLNKVISTWAGNVALLVPETMMVGLGLNKFLPKIFNRGLTSTYKKVGVTNALKSSATAIGAATVTEGIQEAAQDTFNELMTQNELNSKSLKEIVTSPEIQFSALAGAMAGGAMSSTFVAPSTISNIKNELTNNKVINNVSNSRANTAVVPTEEIDKNKAANLQTKLESFYSKQDTLSDSDFIKEAAIIQTELNNNYNIDQQTDYATRRLMNQAIRDRLVKFKDIKDSKAFADLLEKNLNIDRNKILTDTIYFSDLNADELYLNEGKILTEEGRQKELVSLEKMGESLGYSKEQVRKLVKEVHEEAKRGPKGWLTYLEDIEKYDKEENTANTEEEKKIASKNKEATIEKLLYFYNSQLDKAIQFADAAQQIAEGKTRNVSIEYKSKKGKFTLYGNNLASGTVSKGKGIYPLIRSINEGLTSMTKVKVYLTKEQLEAFSTLEQEAKNAMASFSDASLRISSRAKSESKVDIDKISEDSLYNQAKDWLYKTYKLSKRDDLKGREINTLGRLIGRLQNIDYNLLDNIKKDINNSSLNDETKTDILSTLDNVIYQKQMTDLYESKDNIISNAEEVVDKYNNDINNVSDINTINTMLSDITKEYKKVRSLSSFIDTSNMLNKIKEIGKKLRSKQNELIESDNIKNTVSEFNSTNEQLTNDYLDTAMQVAEIDSQLAEENKIYKNINKELEVEEDIDIYQTSLDIETQEQLNEIADTVANNIDNNNIEQIEDIVKDENNNSNNLFLKELNEIKLQEDFTKSKEEIKIENTETYKQIFNNNKLANFTILGKSYNINNEVIVSNNPSSKLAIDGLGEYYSKYISKVLEIADRFKPSYTVDDKGNKIKNPISFIFGHNEKAGKPEELSNFNRSPHMPILYKDMIHDTKTNTVTFKYNELTLAAVDFTVRQFFSTLANEELFPKTREGIVKVFGLPESSISKKELAQLQNVISEYGVPRNFIQLQLGKSILSNLGLKANTKNSKSEYNFSRIATGLGMFAIDYAEQIGAIEKTEFDPSVYNKDKNDTHILEHKIPCIKKGDIKVLTRITDSYLGPKELNNERKTDIGLKTQYEITDSTKTPVLMSPIRPNFKVKGTLQTATPKKAATLKKLNKMAYTVLTNITNFLSIVDLETNRTYGDLLLTRLGAKPEVLIEALSYDDQLSARGETQSLTTQLVELLKYSKIQETNNNDFYFNHYVGKNGRIYLDSNTVNPQTSKNITRFIVIPKNSFYTYKFNDVDSKRKESYAIAQAFNSISSIEDMNKLNDNISNLSKEDLLILRSDLLKLDEKAFIKKYNYLGIKGIENYSQCLNVIEHLLNKIDSKGKDFKTCLMVENDSTTSGYFIRLLQLPYIRILKNIGKQVGVFKSNDTILKNINSINDVKKTIKDLYQTIAIKTSEYLYFTKIVNNKSVIDKEELENFLYEAKDYRQTMFKFLENKNMLNITKESITIMWNALPKPSGDIVSAALRTLMKSPTMTFGYTAGMKSICTNLADSISTELTSTFISIMNKGGLEEYLKNINNEEEKEKVTAIYNTFKYISNNNINRLVKDLKSKPTNEIWININGTKLTLDTYFYRVIAPTYGYAVWSVLETEFAHFIKVNNAMNKITDTMYTIFNTVYKTAYKEVVKSDSNKYMRGLPYQLKKDLEKFILPVLPAISTSSSNSINNFLTMLTNSRIIYKKDGTDLNANLGVTNYSEKNGKLITESVQSMVTSPYGKTERGGAVLPIHNMDAEMMATEQLKFDFTAIFDAVVANADIVDEITKDYNKTAFILNRDLNIFRTFTTRLQQIVNSYELIKNTSLNILPDINSIFDNNFNIYSFINEMDNLSKEIEEIRNEFYAEDNKYTILNMGGFSKVEVDSNTVNNTNYGSGPYSNNKTNSEITSILQKANVDLEARIEVLDQLQELSKQTDNRVINNEHLNILKDIIRKINPNNIKDVVVEVAKDRPFSYGRSEGTEKVIIALDGKNSRIDSVTGLSPFSDKSPAELYVHELIHSAMSYAEKTMDIYELKPLFIKISELQKIMADKVTYEIFMPKEGEYDPKLKSTYEKIAKKQYDYIFANKDTVNFRGMKEFVAFTMSNPALMEAAKNTNIPLGYNNNKKINLVDRLVMLIKSIFEVIFNAKRPDKIIDVLRGNIESRNTVYQELEILNNKIIGLNHKAGNRLLSNPLRILETVMKGVNTFREWSNTKISPKLIKFFNKKDLYDPYTFTVDLTNGYTSDVLKTFKILSGVLTSGTRRKAFIQALSALTNATQEGLLLSTVRTIASKDLQTSRLELLANYTRSIDQQSKALESTVRLDLESKFSKDLSNEERQSLTRCCLMTDLQSLLNEDNSNIEYIKEIISNDKFRKEEIDKIKSNIKKDKNYLYYINQALSLARTMITGKSNEAYNYNANNVVEYNLPKSINKETLIKDIDKLTTLLAIDNTNENYRLIASTLETNGLLNYLISHKTLIKNNLNNTNISTTNYMKGYIKQVIDSSNDLKIDLYSNRDDLNNQGYEIVGLLEESKNTPNTGKIALYRRAFSNPKRRDGAAFILSGINTFKTALRDTAYSLASNTNINTPTQIWNVLFGNAAKSRRRLLHLMKTKEMTMEDFDKYSNNYSPVISPINNRIIDYRINIPIENKIEQLGMDIDGITVLSKMFASQNTKTSSSVMNKAVIEFLKKDMELNMNPITHRNSEDIRYIKLSKNLNNKFFKEAYPVLPTILKEEINKNNFYVREDWLLDLFGTPSLSLNDAKIIRKYTNNTFKKAIAVGEYIMKTLAYLTKQKIVLLIPNVLISNIISNFNISIMQHSNFTKVFRLTMKNAKALREYLEDQKALNLIKLRKDMGTATDKELRDITWYEARLENSIIAPLMKKGMFQSIVEDLKEKDMDSVGKINKIIKNSKLLEKIPNSVKTIFKQINMGEGTPIHDFMFTLTQYSDFIARATEYQLQMEKAPSKYIEKNIGGKKTKVLNDYYTMYEEKVLIDIWHTFINYNKPTSAIQQYSDDMGFTMFTRFALGIQSVIFSKLINNPMGALLFLTSQLTINDTDDILEQNIFNKSWSSIFNNPLDNVVSGVVPMAFQYMFNIGTQSNKFEN